MHRTRLPANFSLASWTAATESAPVGSASLFGKNITLTGGIAPVRAYLEETVPLVLDGTIDPGRVFDRIMPLGEAPAAYAAMDERTALKVMLTV